MTKITLSAVLSDNERTKPLLTGEVVPEGISLATSSVHPSEMFWRQLHFGDFDISEMSMASLYVMVDQLGKDALDWLALPIFTSRQYFHTGVFVRDDSGITEPAGLKGKRVGVPEYQQSSAVWSRGVLEDHFGVTPADVTWFMERGDGMDHASGTGFTPPPGVVINRIPREATMATYLRDGEIDASLMYLKDANLVDRSRGELSDGAPARLLFDVRAESLRFYEESGLYPINHAVVVRRSVVEEHPWVLLNVYGAFVRANDLAYKRMREVTTDYLLPNEVVPMDVNPFRYGIAANEPELETLSRYTFTQGLTSKRLEPSDIFDHRTHNL